MACGFCLLTISSQELRARALFSSDMLLLSPNSPLLSAMYSHHTGWRGGDASGELPNFCQTAVWVVLPMRVLRGTGVHPSWGSINFGEFPLPRTSVNKLVQNSACRSHWYLDGSELFS